MKFCPHCRNKYPGDTKYCLIDGTELLQADPEAETVVTKSPLSNEPVGRNMTLSSIPLEKWKQHTFEEEGLRITMVLRDIFEAEFFERNREVGALLKFSGARILGGPTTIEITPDTFVVPITRGSYEDRSLFFFEHHGNLVQHLRIWVDKN